MRHDIQDIDGMSLPCNRLSFEQLLRKLLAMPGRPAVMLLHWWSPYINRHAFYASAEDGINTIAAYYGALCSKVVMDGFSVACLLSVAYRHRLLRAHTTSRAHHVLLWQGWKRMVVIVMHD